MKRHLPLILLLIPHTTAQPEPRIGARLTYDPQNHQFILYGGADWQNQYHLYGDLWTYKPETDTWTKIETTNTPPPRFNTMLTIIPTTHQLFIYGGVSTNDKTDDTWTLDLETLCWTRINTTPHPSRRSDASITYHPPTDTIILYSGYLQDDTHTQDTWTYNPTTQTWTEQTTTDPPIGQYGHYMITTNNNRLLMYPGHWSIRTNGILIDHGYGGNIWEYTPETQTWTEHPSTPRPPGRYWGQVTYDTTENRIILNGGNGATDYDDTWLYDITQETWTQLETPTRPSKRGSAAIAYDPENHIALLFGGHNEHGQSLGDTWILDCTTLTWSQPGAETQTETPPTETTEPPPTQNQIPGYPLWLTLTTIAITLTRRKTQC